MNWRNITGFILFGIGTALWFLAFAYRMLITSDIPVNFTPEESALAQRFFIVSGIIVLIGTLLTKSKGFYLLSLGIFGSIAIFGWLNKFWYAAGAEYYSAEYARLSNVSIYVPSALALINLIYLLVSVWKNPERLHRSV
ncbi:hypothetical protein FZC78_11020 [Rossellomorea vietnamensis]|uniref:Uncharacterized protein n=1 Tax=Rossellomorea vietnamensis TaxID=218284 RepID=A0A5D4NUX6_9BACI|nr:hypothetical protein [Rossellomorea vietnamensis]TYS17136.1 hypothetical protein FZC78_11020 [Rossellomorea vietnamensis]